MPDQNEQEIALLLQEIERQESNYKEILHKHPDYNRLRAIRDNIRELKNKLENLSK